jgi:hypothetical protein
MIPVPYNTGITHRPAEEIPLLPVYHTTVCYVTLLENIFIIEGRVNGELSTIGGG